MKEARHCGRCAYPSTAGAASVSKDAGVRSVPSSLRRNSKYRSTASRLASHDLFYALDSTGYEQNFFGGVGIGEAGNAKALAPSRTDRPCVSITGEPCHRADEPQLSQGSNLAVAEVP